MLLNSMDSEASELLEQEASWEKRQKLSLLFWQKNSEDTAFSCKYQRTKKMSPGYSKKISQTTNKTIFNETVFYRLIH